MNVIISNRYATMLQQLNVDIIKNLNGEFEVDEIISDFQNFYFQRMILDITAIKDYKDIKNIQKLSISLDMDKVILLLDDSPESSSNEYLSKLISMGIYNFTKNIDGIMYLYNNPNSYRDVAHIHQLDSASVESEGGQKVVPTVIVPEIHQLRVIGFKNITEGAGSTTLIYMLKKELQKNYRVAGIELDSRDFMYFKDKDLISTTNNEFGNTINKYSDYDVVLVDINKSQVAESSCTEVYYLIEPSTIKLNKLMLSNGKILDFLKNKHVVLNKSVLSSKDILDFEYESRLKVAYNIPPLNDRENNIVALNKFLFKIGFKKQQVDETDKKNKILGIFG